MNSVLNGTIEKAVIGNCTEFSMYEITLMYKTDDKDPKMIKNYWTTLKTYVPFGLNIVSPILCTSINVTGVFTFLFFRILFRPGTDLGQDYGIFMVSFNLFILIDYISYLLSLPLHVTFVLCVSIVSITCSSYFTD